MNITCPPRVRALRDEILQVQSEEVPHDGSQIETAYTDTRFVQASVEIFLSEPRQFRGDSCAPQKSNAESSVGKHISSGAGIGVCLVALAIAYLSLQTGTYGLVVPSVLTAVIAFVFSAINAFAILQDEALQAYEGHSA